MDMQSTGKSMAEVQWYYARNDQQFGPVSAAELKQLADAGRLAPDDLLWREGMDAWATAVNLRGLFGADVTSDTPTVPQPAMNQPLPSATTPSRPRPANAAGSGISRPGLLRATQIILWTTCVLVVLTGMVLFTRAFLRAETAADEAAAAAVFATFFIGAYVLARCGEKLSRLL